MSLFQQPIQRKLSSLLGAEVSFGQFRVSLLKGSIEATEVRVSAGEGMEPILTIGRVKAEIVLARALKKELVIRSLVIERPVLALVRGADGGLNVPGRVKVSETATAEAKTEKAAEKAEEGEEAPRALALEMQKVLLVEGEVTYRSDRPESAGSDVGVGGIVAELTQKVGEIGFTLMAVQVGRRDRATHLGELRLHGRFTGVSAVSEIGRAGLEAQGNLGQRLAVQISSDNIGHREFHLALEGSGELGELLALLPDRVNRPVGLSGSARMTVQADYSPQKGLRIPTAQFHLDNLTLPSQA